MIHPAKNPMPGGFSLENFAPSLDAEAGEALGEFLNQFEDPMCDECDPGISESDLMDRLKEALDQRDEARVAVDSINEILIKTQESRSRYREALVNLLAAKDATANYMSRIPDGCSADPAYLERLVRHETRAEDAARLVLTPKP